MSSNTRLASGWATLAGIVLVAIGLLGFLNTSIVGATDGALFRTGTVHDIVHLLTGLAALAIAFGLTGTRQVEGVVGFGILYAILCVAVVASPTLFGLFSVPASPAVHLLHAAVAGGSLAIGYRARLDLATVDR
jgi:hypothetical protein